MTMCIYTCITVDLNRFHSGRCGGGGEEDVSDPSIHKSQVVVAWLTQGHALRHSHLRDNVVRPPDHTSQWHDTSTHVEAIRVRFGTERAVLAKERRTFLRYQPSSSRLTFESERVRQTDKHGRSVIDEQRLPVTRLSPGECAI